MTAAPVDFAAMPRKPEKQPGPDDEVRLVAKLTRSDRARLRGFCSRLGRDMEDVVVEWIMDRLAAEERKLDKR